MTAKEKANNIYNQMLEWVDDAHVYKERNIISTTAKQCALICVDEFIDALSFNSSPTAEGLTEFYEEVKQEINNKI